MNLKSMLTILFLIVCFSGTSYAQAGNEKPHQKITDAECFVLFNLGDREAPKDSSEGYIKEVESRNKKAMDLYNQADCYDRTLEVYDGLLRKHSELKL